MQAYLSVIIPMFNEEENLRRGVLTEVESYLKKQPYSWEVIISDDESTDGSVAFVESFIKEHQHFALLKNKHGGKPFAVRAGIEQAVGEIVLFSDMDQSTPLDQIEKFFPYFEKGYLVVIGSRGQTRTGFSIFRQIASGVFRLIRQVLLLPHIADTQCGFKAFKNNIAKETFSGLQIFRVRKETKGWRVGAFDVELLFIAQKRGYRIAEVPVVWRDKDIATGKQRKFFKESLEMFKEILRVKLNDLRGYYNSSNK